MSFFLFKIDDFYTMKKNTVTYQEFSITVKKERKQPYVLSIRIWSCPRFLFTKG